MIPIDVTTADEAWRQAARRLQGKTKLQAGRDQPTRELLHVMFSLADPRQRIVFARPFNPALAIAEVIWILSGANASEFLISWNPRHQRFVDVGRDTRVFYGAYGHRLGSRPRLPEEMDRMLRIAADGESLPKDQLRSAYQALRHEPDSRQVVLQIWDSERDLPDPIPRSEDVPCNLVSHLMIRDNRLEWLQVMRSNDLIWGTPVNFIQFTCLQEIMAGWLGVDVGNYVQLSDSLHVYERHWADLDGLELDQDAELPTNRSDLRVSGYEEWEGLWGHVVAAAVELSGPVSPDEAFSVVDRVCHLPIAYAEWIAVLAAESLRRNGNFEDAGKLIGNAGEYWATSWRQWSDRKGKDARGCTE